jgi:hypothetical protein
MKVIDKILNEWSFRCHDGIVDMNDPEKIKILNEILNEVDSKQELIDLINTAELSPEQIVKLKKYVTGKISPSSINAKLEELLAGKGLKRTGPLVIYLANNFDIEDKLLEYIEGNSQPTLSDKGNLFTLFSKSKLPEEFIKRLTQTTANQIGTGELLLTTMLKGAKKLQAKSGQGDIEIGGEIIEIKGKGAALSEWGSKSPIKSAFSKIYGITDEKELIQITNNDSWLVKLGDDLKNENRKKAEDVLNELYPNFKLNTSNLNELKKSIAEGFTDQYFKESKIDSILVLDEITGNYQKFNKDSFKKALGNEIQYSFIRDTAPRINLSNEQVSNISELANTGHFQLRLGERGNVLDILNLKEIPLKDYNSSEVKEKLKANISEELKSRATNILSKDIPTSNTYDVGIKVLKPVLVVDNKKYPLKLFAISTKEIKDKEGNVVDTIEVENRGTLYFATVADNKATTLMLLDKEDDNELYFQIKDHASKKKGEGREAKILAPPNYIYEIDLDELMGNKVDQEPTLVDPDTLDYELKAAYKPKSKFVSKSKGEGTIIAASVSGQRSGEPDGNGIVDWVEVEYKFDKPKLKSGKLVYSDIIKYSPVFTTSYKKLKK